MNQEKRNPNSQPAKSQLLSLRRRPSVSDEAGRRGQGMERARIFALPREPSPSHASSSCSCSSVMPIKLPPVHLGQPKVGPENLEKLKVQLGQVQLGQPRAAPQGSRSQVPSLRGDRLSPLSPLPPLPLLPQRPALPRLSPLSPLSPLPRLSPLPCLVSPRDTQSRGTELGSAGEKRPQPCSPCPGQPYSPVPRVFLSPLRVAQEGTARVSPSWQLLSVPPIPSGARAVESSPTGTVPEERENDNELWKDEDDGLTRKALLGGMDTDSSSSPELPGLEEVSRHQKVLEWLHTNFPDSYGAEEENKHVRRQKLFQLKRCQEKVEAQWQELLGVMSSIGSHVFSKGKRSRAAEVSQGEAATQDNTYSKPLGLMDDDEPLEGPSCSRHVGTEVTAESACALPGTSPALWSSVDIELAAAPPSRAAEEEEEELPEPLALVDKKTATPPVLSEEGTSPGTQSLLSAPFNTPASSRAQLNVNQTVTSGTLVKALAEIQALRQQQEEEDALEPRIAADREAAARAKGEGSRFCAPHSPPSPPGQPGAQALRGQPAAPRKRPSRFRRALRALRGLFRCSCIRPQPEE